ncbi:hypothetical protein [Escherichia coli]|uniref:hypothetical protein n=1 Tax=Escherichia coli TaxID=562 RepID=UPI00208E8CB2|nr:hypothetical protein [Escherichia coli]
MATLTAARVTWAPLAEKVTQYRVSAEAESFVKRFMVASTSLAMTRGSGRKLNKQGR